jgi:hypothetical protein
MVGSNPDWYPTGVMVTDAELAAVPLGRHEWHSEWNYTVTSQWDVVVGVRT